MVLELAVLINMLQPGSELYGVSGTLDTPKEVLDQLAQVHTNTRLMPIESDFSLVPPPQPPTQNQAYKPYNNTVLVPVGPQALQEQPPFQNTGGFNFANNQGVAGVPPALPQVQLQSLPSLSNAEDLGLVPQRDVSLQSHTTVLLQNVQEFTRKSLESNQEFTKETLRANQEITRQIVEGTQEFTNKLVTSLVTSLHARAQQSEERQEQAAARQERLANRLFDLVQETPRNVAGVAVQLLTSFQHQSVATRGLPNAGQRLQGKLASYLEPTTTTSTSTSSSSSCDPTGVPHEEYPSSPAPQPEPTHDAQEVDSYTPQEAEARAVQALCLDELKKVFDDPSTATPHYVRYAGIIIFLHYYGLVNQIHISKEGVLLYPPQYRSTGLGGIASKDCINDKVTFLFGVIREMMETIFHDVTDETALMFRTKHPNDLADVSFFHFFCKRGDTPMTGVSYNGIKFQKPTLYDFFPFYGSHNHLRTVSIQFACLPQSLLDASLEYVGSRLNNDATLRPDVRTTARLIFDKLDVFNFLDLRASNAPHKKYICPRIWYEFSHGTGIYFPSKHSLPKDRRETLKKFKGEKGKVKSTNFKPPTKHRYSAYDTTYALDKMTSCTRETRSAKTRSAKLTSTPSSSSSSSETTATTTTTVSPKKRKSVASSVTESPSQLRRLNNHASSSGRHPASADSTKPPAASDSRLESSILGSDSDSDSESEEPQQKKEEEEEEEGESEDDQVSEREAKDLGKMIPVESDEE